MVGRRLKHFITSRIWERNARADPLRAILFGPHAWKRDDFFATGVRQVAALWRRLAELDLQPAGRRALDFGCGVGRLSQALAAHFEEVVGVDVSPTMLEAARRFNQAPARVRYVHNTRPDLAFVADRSVDFALSLIVLQHIPPPMAAGYVRELARILAPGGVLVFQATSTNIARIDERPLSAKSIARRVLPDIVVQIIRQLRRRDGIVIPMYNLPRPEVEALLGDDPELRVQVDADELAQGDFESFSYYVRRSGRPNG